MVRCDFCSHRTCGEYAIDMNCFRCNDYIMVCSQDDVNDGRYVCDCINYDNRNIIIICKKCQKLSDSEKWYKINAIPIIIKSEKDNQEKDLKNAILTINNITGVKYNDIKEFINHKQNDK